MNNVLGLGVYGYCSGNIMCVLRVEKSSAAKADVKGRHILFWVLFCNDKKPISFDTVCDINQMGSGVAVAETAIMTTVYGTRLLLPYRNGTAVPRLFLLYSLVL